MLAIIGTPLILILAATFSSIALDPSTLRSVIEFFGNPFVALTIALLLAYYLLGIRRGWSRKSLETVSTSSLKPVGNILLVVGAGGIFGAVLKGSGIADALADTFNDVGLPVILLAWLISLVLRVAQGSATVAIVTTAGIVAPLSSRATVTRRRTSRWSSWRSRRARSSPRTSTTAVSGWSRSTSASPSATP